MVKNFNQDQNEASLNSYNIQMDRINILRNLRVSKALPRQCPSLILRRADEINNYSNQTIPHLYGIEICPQVLIFSE